MKLRSDFETVRGTLMNRKPVPDLDECFQEVLREEQRLLSQRTANNSKAVNNSDLAFLSREQPRAKDTQQLQCYSCQKYGHIARDCKEKFCRYCRKGGHILTECRRRAQNRGKAYHTTVGLAEESSPLATPAGNHSITTKSIQAMIQSALSTMEIS
uniref:Cellular nucleic acid-binding protein-like n=1 Tax=Elaeis guineensis var. tenera TaxID=51953 RepID=A0A6I9QL21_ELAGV